MFSIEVEDFISTLGGIPSSKMEVVQCCGRIPSSTVKDVQYCGGCQQYCRRMPFSSSTVEWKMFSTEEGYHQYF